MALPKDLEEANESLQKAATATAQVLSRLVSDGALWHNEPRNLRTALDLIGQAAWIIHHFDIGHGGGPDHRFLRN